MLDFGMPPTPVEGQRWFIKQSLVSREYRYLHLQEKKSFGRWTTVHEKMISTSKHAPPFPEATKQAAHDIIRDLKVNFNLPTGLVI